MNARSWTAKILVAMVMVLAGLMASASPVFADCDNWAPSGTTHRNNGNGCYYTCEGNNWSGPQRCDGGGDGTCQGCQNRGADAARAVAQRQREAEQQIERQGGINSEATRRVQQETQQKFNISVNQEVARRNAVAAPETPAGQGGGAVADNVCDPSGGTTGEAGPRSACCMGGVVECGEGTTGQCVGAGIGTNGFCEPASGDSPAAAAGGGAGAGTAPTAAQLAQLDAQLNECLYDENVMIEGTLDAQCISRLSRIQNTLTATTTLTPDQIRARRQIQGDFVTAQADLSRVQALCDSDSAPETCQQDVAAAEQRVAQTSQAVNTQITNTAVRERLTRSAGNYSAHIGQYTADKISKAINAEDTMQDIREKCGAISDAEQQTRCLRLEMQVQLGLDLDTKTGEIVQDENSAFFNSYCLNITQRGMLRETEATAEDREAVKNALAHCGNQVRTAAEQEILRDGSSLTLRPAISDGERCAFPGGCRCSQDGQEWTTVRANNRCVAPRVAGNTCTQSQQGDLNQNGTLRCDCASDAPAGDLQCGWVEVPAEAVADTTREITPAIGVPCTRGADDVRRTGDDEILTCVCNPVTCSWMRRSVDSSEVVTADPGVVRESQLDEYVVSNSSQCTGNMRGCQLPNDPSRYVCVSATLYPETSAPDAGCGRWIEDVRTGVASAPIGFAPDNLVSSNATDQEVEQSIADNLTSCGGEGQPLCIVTTTGNTSVSACDTNLAEVNGTCQQIQSPVEVSTLDFGRATLGDTCDRAQETSILASGATAICDCSSSVSQMRSCEWRVQAPVSESTSCRDGDRGFLSNGRPVVCECDMSRLRCEWAEVTSEFGDQADEATPTNVIPAMALVDQVIDLSDENTCIFGQENCDDAAIINGRSGWVVVPLNTNLSSLPPSSEITYVCANGSEPVPQYGETGQFLGVECINIEEKDLPTINTSEVCQNGEGCRCGFDGPVIPRGSQCRSTVMTLHDGGLPFCNQRQLVPADTRFAQQCAIGDRGFGYICPSDFVFEGGSCVPANQLSRVILGATNLLGQAACRLNSSLPGCVGNQNGRVLTIGSRCQDGAQCICVGGVMSGNQCVSKTNLRLDAECPYDDQSRCVCDGRIIDGVCKPKGEGSVCYQNFGQQRCTDGLLYTCEQTAGPIGQWRYAGGSCNADTCTPLESQCIDGDPSAFTMCNSAGTGMSRHQCAAGKLCSNGRCIDQCEQTNQIPSGTATVRGAGGVCVSQEGSLLAECEEGYHGCTYGNNSTEWACIPTEISCADWWNSCSQTGNCDSAVSQVYQCAQARGERFCQLCGQPGQPECECGSVDGVECSLNVRDLGDFQVRTGALPLSDMFESQYQCAQVLGSIGSSDFSQLCQRCGGLGEVPCDDVQYSVFDTRPTGPGFLGDQSQDLASVWSEEPVYRCGTYQPSVVSSAQRSVCAPYCGGNTGVQCPFTDLDSSPAQPPEGRYVRAGQVDEFTNALGYERIDEPLPGWSAGQ